MEVGEVIGLLWYPPWFESFEQFALSALFCIGGLTPLGAQAVNLMLGGIALVFFGLGARKGKVV